MNATRLNSFKVRLENFYAIYSGIFRTDLTDLMTVSFNGIDSAKVILHLREQITLYDHLSH